MRMILLLVGALLALAVGDPVPKVTLKLDDGTELKLAEAKQAVVLYFYPKDDTAG